MIKLIAFTFVFFSFFPYVSFIPNKFDSQPFALLFGLLYLLLVFSNRAVVNKKVVGFLVLFYVFLLLFVLDLFLFNDFGLVLRTFANYATLCFLPIAFYYFLKNYGFPKVTLKISILIYTLAAFIQVFFSKYVFEFLVHVRTSDDRGVTSLTPEPTYYGIICYLFLITIILTDSFSKKEKLFYGFLLVFQILFLAKSSMVILYLLFLMMAFVLASNLINIKNIVVALLMSFILFYFVEQYNLLDGSRLLKLINMASTGGIYIFSQDASMNDRLSHVYVSFYGFFEDITLPGLFSTFKSVLERKSEISNGFFWYGGAGNKIMSFWGTIIYELGFVSFLYIGLVFRSISQNKIFMVFAFIIPLLAAVPIANPIVALIIALGFFKLEVSSKR